jgi:probable rRNA maturation factor
MPILVQTNAGRIAQLRKSAVKYLLDSLLEVTGNKGKSLSLVSIGRNQMVHLNRQYRRKNKATDVLSFPGHEEYIGEIYICPDVLQSKTRDRDLLMDKLCRKLIVHGFAHLMGYDHETYLDYLKMRKIEAKLWREGANCRLLKTFNKPVLVS